MHEDPCSTDIGGMSSSVDSEPASDGSAPSHESNLIADGDLVDIPTKDSLDSDQSGPGCEDQGALDRSAVKPEAPHIYKIILADPNAPKPDIKRYAHHGKRRRSYTEELFRCQHTTKVVSDELVCGALLWKNRSKDLRSHLLSHLDLATVQAMSDEQVLQSYTDAKRIFLEALPDDEIFGQDEDDLDEDEDSELQGDSDNE